MTTISMPDESMQTKTPPRVWVVCYRCSRPGIPRRYLVGDGPGATTTKKLSRARVCSLEDITEGKGICNLHNAKVMSLGADWIVVACEVRLGDDGRPVELLS